MLYWPSCSQHVSSSPAGIQLPLREEEDVAVAPWGVSDKLPVPRHGGRSDLSGFTLRCL